MRVFIADMPFHGESISQRITKTPEGFLIAHDVRIARTGTQIYAGSELGLANRATDRITAYRLEDDVFNETALKSFEGKPITDDHPPGDMVTPENYRLHTRGHIQNVRRDGIYIMADLVIKDASLIQKVESGKRQVSAGYWCDYDEYKDGYRQCNIIANHLSVVDKGRAGDKVLIRDHEINGDSSMTYTAEQVAALLNAQAVKDTAPVAPVAAPSHDSLMAKMLDALLGKSSKPAKDEDDEDEKEDKKKETSDAALRAEIAELKKTVDSLTKAKAADEDDEDEDDDKKAAKDAVAEILATLDEDDDEDEEEKKESKDAEYKAARDALKPALVGMSPAKQQKAKDALREKYGKKPTSDAYLYIAKGTKDTSSDEPSAQSIQEAIKKAGQAALGAK